jgi:hypothetical protein
VSFADGKRSLVLRQIATTSNVELIPLDETRLYGPRFSPDGNHIYYVSAASGSPVETLYRIPILGGGSSRVLEDIATPVEFSPATRGLAKHPIRSSLSVIRQERRVG